MAGNILTSAPVLCFIFLQTAVSEGSYCSEIPEEIAAKFCRSTAVTNITTLYLDSSGVPREQTSECGCLLSSTGNLTNINISSVPSSRPSTFELAVNGANIDTSVRLPYETEVRIVLRTISATVMPVLCLEITGEFDDTSVEKTLSIKCFQQSATPKPNGDDQDNEGSRPNTGDDQDNEGSRPNSGNNQVNGSSGPNIENDQGKGDDGLNTGVIVGSVAGGLFVVVIVVVVVMCLACRRRRNSPATEESTHGYQNEKDPEYDMTIHEGYVSADDVDIKAKQEEQTIQPYEEIVPTESAPSTKHEVVEYSVVNKPRAEETKTTDDSMEEHVYDRTNEANDIRPTGNIYGVGIPVDSTV